MEPKTRWEIPSISHPALRQLVVYINIHRIDLPDKEVITRILKNLEIEIDRDIQKKVKALNSSRFILLTGESLYMLEAIASYIYLTTGNASLYLYSFLNKSEQERESIFAYSRAYYNARHEIRSGSVFDRLDDGCFVFFSNLECKDGLFLKKLASEARDIKSKWHYRKDNKGLLIVSTLNLVEDIPMYFKGIFDEVIDLSPKKQVQSNGQDIKAQGNVFKWAGGTWEITYKGKTIRPQKSDGLTYIHYLICNQGKTFYAKDLQEMKDGNKYQENKQQRPRVNMLDVQIDDEGAVFHKQISYATPQNLKIVLKKAEDQLQEAETEEKREGIQKIIASITARIETLEGDGSAEKARVAVTQAISRAYDIIEREKHSELHEHLKARLTQGTKTTYSPPNKVEWVTA